MQGTGNSLAARTRNADRQNGGHFWATARRSTLLSSTLLSSTLLWSTLLSSILRGWHVSKLKRPFECR